MGYIEEETWEDIPCSACGGTGMDGPQYKCIKCSGAGSFRQRHVQRIWIEDPRDTNDSSSSFDFSTSSNSSGMDTPYSASSYPSSSYSDSSDLEDSGSSYSGPSYSGSSYSGYSGYSGSESSGFGTFAVILLIVAGIVGFFIGKRLFSVLAALVVAGIILGIIYWIRSNWDDILGFFYFAGLALLGFVIGAVIGWVIHLIIPAITPLYSCIVLGLYGGWFFVKKL